MDQSIRLPGGRLCFLLIHGLGVTPLEMRYVAQRLHHAGCTVHVPQLAGHCGSSDDLRATRWADWCVTVENEHERLKARCDTIVVGGLSMGAILALHHAASHTDDISALALYAPTLWLDGWGVPWYAGLIQIVKIKRWADFFPFAERHPWGIKDQRLRALVEQAIKSGDSSRAGVAALPGGQMLELRQLVKQVRKEIAEVTQPTLIVFRARTTEQAYETCTTYSIAWPHPPRPSFSTIAIIWSRSIASARLSPDARSSS